MSESAKLSLADFTAEGRALFRLSSPTDAHRRFRTWVDNVAAWLDERYPESGLSAIWSGLGHDRLVVGGSYDNSDSAWGDFRSILSLRLNWLGQAISSLQTAQTGDGAAGSEHRPTTRKVFVVHGRREAPRESVARFLENLGLEAVILHEQPNKGRTIIEKFTDYSDVGFAVVLLTGDDRGFLATDSADTARPRARQNVILELGYFLARLGRHRVCALYEEGVEIPSDYSGVLFVLFDPHGGWREKLVRELTAAGLPVGPQAKKP